MVREHERRSAVGSDGEGRPVLYLSGEWDLATIDELDRLLAGVTAGSPPRVVIDLREVEFMDCAGARPILRWRRRLPAEECAVVLRSPNPAVRRVVEILGLDGPCTIED